MKRRMGPLLSIFTVHSFLANMLNSPHHVSTSSNNSPGIVLNNHHPANAGNVLHRAYSTSTNHIFKTRSGRDSRLAYTTLEYHLPTITAIRIEGNDKGVTYDNGISVILANVPTSIRFFGRHLTNHTLVKFTSDHGSKESNCNDAETTVEYPLTWSNSESATLEMYFPEADHEKEYFVCVGENSSSSASGDNWIDWKHQGMDRWITIKVYERLLPLWAQLIFISFLLLVSGLFAGLTLGLLALDRTDLKILSSTGSLKERKYAKTILPLRTRGNFLLCSLVLGNVLVNSTLTILLDDLTSGIVAVITSTAGIVIFGEIIPQAICSRNGLAIGAKTVWITKCLMFITFPLSYTISILLDKILGEEIGIVYDREKLKELILVTIEHNDLEIDEVNIISGALTLKKKTVEEIMTKLDDVFMLPIDAVLDFELFTEIRKQGFSRIPIYEGERRNIVSLLHTKDLVFVDSNDKIQLKVLIEFYNNTCFFVFSDTTLDVMFNTFKTGNKGHMAFVQRIQNREGPGDPYYEAIGLVTMEDVLEELLQAEILDENDVGKIKSRLEAKEVPFISQKKLNPAIAIPPQLALAACQYLTTAIPAFNRNLVSENILERLIKATVNIAKPPRKSGVTGTIPHNIYLYESGKPTDYFIMILEGKAQVEVGKEKINFQAGAFQAFGSEFLVDNLPNENLPEYNQTIFTPDYTVRVITECIYIKIKFSVYRAARVATELEKKYASGSPRENQEQSNDWETEVEKMLNIVNDDDSIKLRLQQPMPIDNKGDIV